MFVPAAHSAGDPAALRALIGRYPVALPTTAGPSGGATSTPQDGMPEGRAEKLLPYIRGFRLTITALDGTTKLSQAHPPADRLRIIRGLLAEGDAGAREIARLMVEREG